MANAQDLLRVRADNPDYQRQVHEEAVWWDQPHRFNVDAQIADEYLSELFSGDPHVSWYETIPRYGAFEKGCALGTAPNQHSTILEQNPRLHLTVFDISEASLAAEERNVGARFPGRFATQCADLNFAQLEPNAYDLIVSDSCLHHLVNLEHLAYQVDAALRPAGYFFMRDYVGESQFQYPPEKKRALEDALDDVRRRRPGFGNLELSWPKLSDWPFSPFEAIRSQEILDVLGQTLSVQSVAQAGAVLMLVLFVKPPESAGYAVPDRRAGAWRRFRFALGRARRRVAGSRLPHPELMQRLANELVPLDRVASQEGRLRPMIAFGVYRKR